MTGDNERELDVRGAPGVNFPSDYMTEDEIAAMSSECITVTPPKGDS